MRTSPELHRRTFLAAGLAMTATGASAAAQPFFKRHGLPIGIQLYSVGPDAQKDLDGTLAALARTGYRAVELAGFYGRTPKEFKAALDKAGLVSPSAHVQARGKENSFEGDLGKLADDLAVLGVKTAVMPSPYIPDRAVQAAAGTTGADYFRKLMSGLTADDWKFNADYLNKNAAALKKSGIRVGYHNHNMEFRPIGTTSGIEILLKNTDPALVTFECDVGWVAAAGVDPLTFIKAHKHRFSMMHVKDLKADTKPNYDLSMDPTEVGSGRLDWKTLLAGAYAEGVRGFYVEQEPPFAHPRLESAKLCHDYLARLNA